MEWDLRAYRLVTASAYPGMMAPLTEHPSCVCVLSGDADAQPRAGMAPVLSLEGRDGVRRRWRFGDVARLAEFVPKILGTPTGDDRPVLLVPPRSSDGWRAAAAAWPSRARVAASPLTAAERIATDKIYVRDALSGLGLPVPRAVATDAESVTFEAVRREVGRPFVLQSPNGAGGQGTYLIADRDELLRALAANPHVARWLISRYAGDTTINVAGVVHHDGVALLPASVQISGIAEVGSGFGAYCGSAFGPTPVAGRVLDEAYAHVAAAGQWLRAAGHLGLYGVDIAVDGDDLALLEVNPRIQGSSWLLSSLQTSQRYGRPCLEQHMEALLGRPLGSPLVPATDVPPGQHILVRWCAPAAVVRGAPPEHPEITGRPVAGTVIQPGAILARIASPTPLATPDGRTLTAHARALIATARGDQGVDRAVTA